MVGSAPKPLTSELGLFASANDGEYVDSRKTHFKVGLEKDELGAQNLPWKKNTDEKSFVRGSRPQSAKMSRTKSKPGFMGGTFVAGTGVVAARAKKAGKKLKKSRPSTAPIQGRKGTKSKQDDWYSELKKNGLLPKPRPSSISQKYLIEAAQKRKEEEETLIAQTQKEQINYERSCIARMAEATRWAQTLGLQKKFHPIYTRPSTAFQKKREDDKAKGISRRGAVAKQKALPVERGELRCEIIAKEDSKSRTISCSLFEREHEKLLVRHRKMLLEEESRATSTVNQALQDAGVHVQAPAAGNLRKQHMLRLMQEQTINEQRENSSTQGKSKKVSARDTAAKCDIEKELRGVIDETEALTQILQNQMKLLKENGWNCEIMT